MVMSYHNFQDTPDAATLDAKFARAQELGADIGKVAVMPKDPADVLALLAATWRASQALTIPLISMSMGGIGSLSRMIGLGLRFGGDLRRRQVELGTGAGRHRRAARRAGDDPRRCPRALMREHGGLRQKCSGPCAHLFLGAVLQFVQRSVVFSPNVCVKRPSDP